MTDDKNTYFDNDFGCKEKCENIFPNCYSCNKTHCNKCKSGYYINYDNKCLKKLINVKMILFILIIHNVIDVKAIIVV
jgi:hypothetical protein